MKKTNPCFRELAKTTSVAVWLGILSSSVVHAHSNDGAVQEDGRFTPNQLGEIFPPQHREIENVIWYKPVAETRSIQLRSGMSAKDVDAITSQVESTPEVVSLLGARYRHLSTNAIMEKNSDVVGRYEVTFYSYSNDHTVTANFYNGKIETLNAVSAQTHQPALSEEEMAEAIDIATQHWLANGSERVNQLVGYAIQTFKPDGSPFSSRMTYVSFHTASPEVPEFLTWVDLSAGTVTRAEVAQ